MFVYGLASCQSKGKVLVLGTVGVFAKELFAVETFHAENGDGRNEWGNRLGYARS